MLFKNGVEYTRKLHHVDGYSKSNSSISIDLDLNATDFLEIKVSQTTAFNQQIRLNNGLNFSGHLVYAQ